MVSLAEPSASLLPFAAYYREPLDSNPKNRLTRPGDSNFVQRREQLIPAWEEGMVYHESLKPKRPDQAGKQTALERAAWCQSLTGAVECQSPNCAKVHADGKKLRKICKQRFHPKCMGAQGMKPLWRKQVEVEEHSSQVRILRVSLGSFAVSDSDTTLRERQENLNQTVDDLYAWNRELCGKVAPHFVKNAFIAPRVDLHRDWLTCEVVIVGVLGNDENEDDVMDFIGNHYREVVTPVIDHVGDGIIKQVEFLDTGEGTTTAQRIIKTWGQLMAMQVYFDNADDFLALLEAFKSKRLVQPRGFFYRYPVRANSDGDRDDSNNGSGDPLLVSSLVKDFDPLASDSDGGGQSPSGFVPEPPPPCAFCGSPTRWVGRVPGPWKKVKGDYSGLEVWFHPRPPASAGEEGST